MKKLLGLIVVTLVILGAGCTTLYKTVPGTTLPGVVLKYKFYSDNYKNSYSLILSNNGKKDFHFCRVEFDDYFGTVISNLQQNGPILNLHKYTGSDTFRRGASIKIENSKSHPLSDKFIDYSGHKLSSAVMPATFYLICNEGKETWALLR